jgi:hypothetical protein
MAKETLMAHGIRLLDGREIVVLGALPDDVCYEYSGKIFCSPTMSSRLEEEASQWSKRRLRVTDILVELEAGSLSDDLEVAADCLEEHGFSDVVDLLRLIAAKEILLRRAGNSPKREDALDPRRLLNPIPMVVRKAND